jgi:hypothetical protein
MTTDSPVVEELLEKGARALYAADWADTPDKTWESVDSGVRKIYREQAGVVLDAVLPGWREGITREWQTTHMGKRVGIAGDLGKARDERADWSRDVPEEELGFAARWVGPWLPVEDGTT